MMLNQACLSFPVSKAFIEPGAWRQGSPVTDHLALLSYSQGLAGVGWRLNLRGPVMHRAPVDIQKLPSVRRTVTELWLSFWLHIRFTEQLFSNHQLKRSLVKTYGVLWFSYTAHFTTFAFQKKLQLAESS